MNKNAMTKGPSEEDFYAETIQPKYRLKVLVK